MVIFRPKFLQKVLITSVRIFSDIGPLILCKHSNPSSWYRLLFLTPCFLPRIDISRLTHSHLLDHHNFSRLYQIMIPVIVFSQGLSRENNQDLWYQNWFEVVVEWYLYKAWCEIKIVYGSKLNLKATSPWTFL